MKRITLKEVFFREGPERQALEDEIVKRLSDAVSVAQKDTDLIKQTNNAVVSRDAIGATRTLNKLYGQFVSGNY